MVLFILSSIEKFVDALKKSKRYQNFEDIVWKKHIIKIVGFILVLLTDNCIFLVSKIVGTFCFKFTKCGFAKICKYQTNYKRPVQQHWEHVYSWNQIACLPFCCRDTTQFDGLRIYVTNIGSSKVYPSRFSTAPLFSNEALKKVPEELVL